MGLDDTLFHAAPYYSALFQHVCAGLADRIGGDSNEYRRRLEEVADELTRDHPRLFEAFRERAELPETAAVAIERAISSFDPGALSLFPDADRFIEETQAPIAIVTHGDGFLERQKIRALGLADRVDMIVFAAEYGEAWRPPSVLPYRTACRAFETRPSDCVYIGANPFIDFEGASSLGMRCIRLRRGQFGDRANLPWLEPLRCVESLTEVGPFSVTGLVTITR